MATRARELPRSLLRLPEYRPPDLSKRVTHCEIWNRLRERARREGSARAVFPNGF